MVAMFTNLLNGSSIRCTTDTPSWSLPVPAPKTACEPPKPAELAARMSHSTAGNLAAVDAWPLPPCKACPAGGGRPRLVLLLQARLAAPLAAPHQAHNTILSPADRPAPPVCACKSPYPSAMSPAKFSWVPKVDL